MSEAVTGKKKKKGSDGGAFVEKSTQNTARKLSGLDDVEKSWNGNKLGMNWELYVRQR